MRNQLNGKWLNKSKDNSHLEIKGGVLIELIFNGESLIDKSKTKNILEEIEDIKTFWDVENSIGLKTADMNMIKAYKFEEPFLLETALFIGEFIRQ